MNFRQLMMDKLKTNVAYKVANNSTLINEVADRVLDELDYREIADDLNISSSDIADELDNSDIIMELRDHLDLDEIARAVADKYNVSEITEKVIELLPCNFLDDLAVLAAEEIVSEME